MASVRNLKKDIDFLVMEVYLDCHLFKDANPAKAEEVNAIIDDTDELLLNMYERANHPDGKHEPKLVKKHYSALRKDLFAGANSLFERLSSLSK